MLSIAVCDDEVMECFRLSKTIKEILEEMNIPCMIHQFNCGKDLLEAQENFDIVFLDIMMSELDGMKTARIFRRVSDQILIFISSSREYVFEAYDVEAFWYLLKPIDRNKLKKVLKRAVLKSENNLKDFILVSKDRQTVKLFLNDIYYFEVKGRMIHVHGKFGNFTYYGQLGALEDSIRDKGFFRCHKSYLINLNYVSVYNRNEVTLDHGEKIVIAKRRYEEFCREILSMMRKS